MRYLTKRRVLVIVLAVAAVFAVVLFGKWRDASNRGGQLPAEPFRIAGNLYYVGANDVTSFLLTGPEGHVLIDGGYPGTAPMIMASIAKLGFKITDVKVLLNSHAHFDHAGGLAELQKASGAKLWVSEGDADIVAAGGAGDPTLGPFRLLSYLPFLRYPSPRVDHRFKDGATMYPEIRAEFERSFRTLRSLPVDIWVTSHAREFGRYRKFRERENAKDPADPFIDRDGYVRYIDSAEMRFRRLVAERPPRPN